MKRIACLILMLGFLATTTFAQTKKDGSADKRFKANKEAKAKVPLKKDGTPDKRFKGNKTTKKG